MQYALHEATELSHKIVPVSKISKLIVISSVGLAVRPSRPTYFSDTVNK